MRTLGSPQQFVRDPRTLTGAGLLVSIAVAVILAILLAAWLGAPEIIVGYVVLGVVLILAVLLLNSARDL